MAKRAAGKETETVPGVLPVPEPVVRHHLPTIAGSLREWKAQGRIPPVLLLTGTAGCGKRSLGYWLAQWILCERSGMGRGTQGEPEGEDPFTSSLFGGGEAPAASEAPPSHEDTGGGSDPRPCGECASCQRALKGNWVDFTEVLPEDSGDGPTSGALKVDQFRELKQKLGFGAHEGAYRIVLIPNAERMTVQAANSVLKLLEEPPPGWVFFLTASDPTLLLPTILSRCQQLRLKPFKAVELEELLGSADLDPQRRQICARLAHGSWSKALALAGEETWESRGALLDFLREPSSKIAALVDWASQEPRNFDLLVDQLELLTGDLIRWSLVPAPAAHAWDNLDGARVLEGHAKAVTKRQGSVAHARRFWVERSLRLAVSRQESLAPLNRKLLIQDLLLPWLEAM